MTLPAGTHTIVFEFYENGGFNSWYSSGGTDLSHTSSQPGSSSSPALSWWA